MADTDLYAKRGGNSELLGAPSGSGLYMVTSAGKVEIPRLHMTVDAGSPGGILHGEDLRSPLEAGTNVGIEPLLGANWESMIETPPFPGEGFYRVSASQWGQWPHAGFPDEPYVYNNDPDNHGGWVPAGGLMIDGYFVPEGTYIVQFMDLSAGFYFSDAQFGFMLRGCRCRQQLLAPGLFNVNGPTYGGEFMGAHYCDVGGLGPEDADRFEVGFKIEGSQANGTHVQMVRNYFSYYNTAIQFPSPWVHSFELIENYCEKPNYNYGPAGPNGDNDDIHINGVWISGGQTHCLILRNKIVGQHPDELGRTVGQTDCIIWFQGGGPNLGTGGPNSDSTSGYQTRDNYLGGTGWVVYAGKPDAQPVETAHNFTYTGNKITTQWWPNGGYYGPISEEPLWGSYGNTKDNNTWADGPNVGQEW